MILSVLALIIGIIVLVVSADRFIEGAATIARQLGLSPLLIGMLIVGFGTSAPEILVSFMAAMSGNPKLALGNGIGSNISNVGLILGITAVMIPLNMESRVIRQEIPLLIGINLMIGLLFYDGHLAFYDGMVLLCAFLVFLVWSVRKGKEFGDDLDREYEEKLSQVHLSRPRAWAFLVFGLVFLVASSRLMVWGAVDLASRFGVSDLIIGLTIVAVGTSLPELASSIVAARKGEHDIAIGNVVGSNIFNSLVVIGLPAFLSPFKVPDEVIYRDYPVMLGFTLLLFVVGFGFRGQGRINRYEGFLLLLLYSVYTFYLVRAPEI